MKQIQVICEEVKVLPVDGDLVCVEMHNPDIENMISERPIGEWIDLLIEMHGMGDIYDYLHETREEERMEYRNEQ